MDQRPKDKTMKKTLLMVFLLAAFLVTNCGAKESRRETAESAFQTKAQDSVKPRPGVDTALDDWVSFLSGLPVGKAPYASWEEQTAWQDYRKDIDEHWPAFAKAISEPMERWAATDLRDARRATTTLFYPFGGPDFVTAFAFFPDAVTTVLLGLEPAGNLPDLAKSTPEAAALYFKDFGSLLTDFLKRGYFVTKHMNDIYGANRVDGSLPVIAFFMKRTGNSIVDMKRVWPDAKGEWHETAYEIVRRLPRRPYGIRIDYLRKGDDVRRTVYYFSCDLEDKAFTKGSPLYRFCAGLEGVSSYIKSGSYLLHYVDFANIRNLILAKSAYVLEDDTGIPYRYFRDQGWTIQLYGAYAKPVEDFSGVEQNDLKAAYENPASHVKTLPFHFGYRWVTHVDNLLLVKRPAAAAKIH